VSRTFHDSAALATAESRPGRSYEQRGTPDRSKVSNAQTLADHIEGVESALTAREPAKILSVSAVTVFKMAMRGVMPSLPRRQLHEILSGRDCSLAARARRLGKRSIGWSWV